MTVAYMYITIFYLLVYIARKISKYKKGQCPKGKMSSIGKYRRNAYSYLESLWLVFRWSFYSLLDVIMLIVYNTFQTQLGALGIFYLNNVIMFSWTELFYIVFTIVLS